MTMSRSNYLFLFFLFFLFLFSQVSIAGVVVGGTRVVYDGSKREASLSVKNPEKKVPYLIQSWIEKDNPQDAGKAPFIITPPLFRLDAGQENLLRIMRVGGNLPDNRESVFWLNVKSIPSTEKSDQNQLQITVRTRIKLFYRPASLKGEKAEEAYKSLVVKKVGDSVQINNPTPFYISFYSLKINSKEIDAPMIAPGETQNYPVSGAGKATWQAINDFGGITSSASATF
ncbi:fimbrial biogenesis chaperone [Pantoea agglomerans]|uniref:fimbrial biogenesis chaperone n=1 Tax=Enterobacter agglomerans TaxID=549 RepID=UPI003D9FD81C